MARYHRVRRTCGLAARRGRRDTSFPPGTDSGKRGNYEQLKNLANVTMSGKSFALYAAAAVHMMRKNGSMCKNDVKIIFFAFPARGQ